MAKIITLQKPVSQQIGRNEAKNNPSVVSTIQKLFSILKNNQGTKNQDHRTAITLMERILQPNQDEIGKHKIKESISKTQIVRNFLGEPNEESYYNNTHFLLLQIVILRYTGGFKSSRDEEEINGLLQNLDNRKRMMMGKTEHYGNIINEFSYCILYPTNSALSLIKANLSNPVRNHQELLNTLRTSRG